MIAYCSEQARVPVALYKLPEVLFQRTSFFKRGLLGPGPGTRKLSRTIMETKLAFDRKITDLLNQLSTLSMSLDVTVKVLDKEKHDVIRGRTVDHLDSVNNKIERLQSLKERLGRKLDKIAKKGAIRFVNTGYKNKNKIILYGGSRIEI